MADYDFPRDLIEAQRAYWAADAHVDEVVADLPSSQGVLEGAMTDEQKQELAVARGARLDALDALNRHSFWATVDNRHAAWTKLQQTARA